MVQERTDLGYPIPSNELERLENLSLQAILDTGSEADFDRITAIAKSLFDVPLALITFIDKDRQWFKSCIGVDASETTRDVAFCAHAIMSEDVLVCLDARKDNRFKKNPFVTGETNVRFYAGAPIMSPEGFVLGTVCILDIKPRKKFDEVDIENLRHMSVLVSMLLGQRKQSRLSEDKNLAKTEFLNHITHELRTPLNTIVGISNILKNKTVIEERDFKLFKTLSYSADSLMELINTVLDINAIETRDFKLNVDKFFLPQVLDEIENIMKQRAEEKNIDFVLDISSLEDQIMDSDKIRLKQILLNIIGNAIKFTDNGMVMLKVSTCKNGEVEFQIIDTGVGIAEDKIEFIFGKYNQAHGEKSIYQGTGLGLNIAKDLIEKLGGKIRVTSKEGMGSTFTVNLPNQINTPFIEVLSLENQQYAG